MALLRPLAYSERTEKPMSKNYDVCIKYPAEDCLNLSPLDPYFLLEDIGNRIAELVLSVMPGEYKRTGCGADEDGSYATMRLSFNNAEDAEVAAGVIASNFNVDVSFWFPEDSAKLFEELKEDAQEREENRPGLLGKHENFDGWANWSETP
jgi:hypothetical protein